MAEQHEQVRLGIANPGSLLCRLAEKLVQPLLAQILNTECEPFEPPAQGPDEAELALARRSAETLLEQQRGKAVM
jgi:hypothetical protein